MKILLLGDIMGPSGRKAIIENLPELIKKKEIDFVILNGENAANSGLGITDKIVNEFFDVVIIVLGFTFCISLKKVSSFRSIDLKPEYK